MIARTVNIASLALACMAASAQGQATVNWDSRYVNATTEGRDGNFNYINGYVGERFVDDTTDLDELFQFALDEPDFGSASVSAGQTSAYSPSSPGLGGQFTSLSVDMSGSAAASSDPFGYFFGRATVSTYIGFTVDSPTPWEWNGHFTGTSFGGEFQHAAQYSAQVASVDQMGNYTVEWEETLYSDVDQPIAASGMLQPGNTYYLYVNFDALATSDINNGGKPAAADAHLNAVFSVPAPGAAALVGLSGLHAARRRPRR